jgi:ERCC4-related helicase
MVALNQESTTDPLPESVYLSSHPKMKALKDIITDHFKTFPTSYTSTRVMIFSQVTSYLHFESENQKIRFYLLID